MEVISKHWNVDLNYWDLHPIMKTITVFKDLYNNDKSKGKTKSSTLMWAVAMYIDPNDENPWRNVAKEDKGILIAEDFLEDKKFNWEDTSIKTLTTSYIDLCLTSAEKEFVRLEKKLKERGDFIERTPYSLDSYSDTGKLVKGTADQLDKMVLGTGKINDQMDDIRAKLSKEQAEGHTKGGRVESASEEGLL